MININNLSEVSDEKLKQLMIKYKEKQELLKKIEEKRQEQIKTLRDIVEDLQKKRRGEGRGAFFMHYCPFCRISISSLKKGISKVFLNNQLFPEIHFSAMGSGFLLLLVLNTTHIYFKK